LIKNIKPVAVRFDFLINLVEQTVENKVLNTIYHGTHNFWSSGPYHWSGSCKVGTVNEEF